MATRLNLPDCPKTLVFRRLVSFLRADPHLSRVFRPTSIHAWEGKPTDKAEPADNQSPFMRLTPSNGSQGWWSPDAQVGDLVVRVDLTIAGLDATDMLNLWYAIERALYPRDDPSKVPASLPRLKIANALRDAGAETGACEFSQPANVEGSADGGSLHASGQIRLSVVDTLNA